MPPRSVWMELPVPASKATLKAYAGYLPVLKRRLRAMQRQVETMEAVLLSGKETERTLCDLDDEGTLKRHDTGEIIKKRNLQLDIFATGAEHEQEEEA